MHDITNWISFLWVFLQILAVDCVLSILRGIHSPNACYWQRTQKRKKGFWHAFPFQAKLWKVLLDYTVVWQSFCLLMRRSQLWQNLSSYVLAAHQMRFLSLDSRTRRSETLSMSCCQMTLEFKKESKISRVKLHHNNICKIGRGKVLEKIQEADILQTKNIQNAV